MSLHLKILFIPHEHNNHKPKILHLSSLCFFLFLIIAFQIFISLFHRFQPGVLGYASNIEPQMIVDLTNQYRSENGLNSLTVNPKLAEAAREKAADMFAKNYWSHYSPLGTTPWWFFENAGYNYLYAGENLARDFGESSEVVNAWLASPSHKENIINNHYQEIGVAVVNGSLNGEETTLVVQLFGTPAGLPAVSETQAALPQVNAATVKQTSSKPLISSFTLTKSLNLSLLILLLLVLLIDAVFIWKNKILRLSGKSFIHFTFLAIILLIVLVLKSGQII